MLERLLPAPSRSRPGDNRDRDRVGLDYFLLALRFAFFAGFFFAAFFFAAMCAPFALRADRALGRRGRSPASAARRTGPHRAVPRSPGFVLFAGEDMAPPHFEIGTAS
jgi:hypothetical protein